MLKEINVTLPKIFSLIGLIGKFIESRHRHTYYSSITIKLHLQVSLILNSTSPLLTPSLLAAEAEPDDMLCGLNMLVSTPAMCITLNPATDSVFRHSSERFNITNEQLSFFTLNFFSVFDVCLFYH